VAAAAVERWQRWRRMSKGLICAVRLTRACPARRPFASESRAMPTLPLTRIGASQLLDAPAQIWHGWVVVVMRRVRVAGLFGEE
jgi:hypothetical protein